MPEFCFEISRFFSEFVTFLSQIFLKKWAKIAQRFILQCSAVVTFLSVVLT